MTNREAANQIASKITGKTVNARTTKEALDAITGKKSGTIAEALDTISQGEISYTAPEETNSNSESETPPAGDSDPESSNTEGE